jgi:phosphoglucosamine mutase
VPQVLVNVRVATRVDLDGSDAVGAAIAEARRALGNSGRVLVRGSGTEPLVRIMVEADEPSVAEETAERLRQVVAAEFETA